MTFYLAKLILITDVEFRGINDILSTVGGTAISIKAILSLLFSIGIYNNWEMSIVRSVKDEKDIKNEKHEHAEDREY